MRYANIVLSLFAIVLVTTPALAEQSDATTPFWETVLIEIGNGRIDPSAGVLLASLVENGTLSISEAETVWLQRLRHMHEEVLKDTQKMYTHLCAQGALEELESTKAPKETR